MQSNIPIKVTIQIIIGAINKNLKNSLIFKFFKR
jgi:hypothetical protein